MLKIILGYQTWVNVLMMFQNLHACHVFSLDALGGNVVAPLQCIHVLNVEITDRNALVVDAAIIFDVNAGQAFDEGAEAIF